MTDKQTDVITHPAQPKHAEARRLGLNRFFFSHNHKHPSTRDN